MKAGQNVTCFDTMRKSKAYAHFGTPARVGDKGVVQQVVRLKGVIIVVMATADGPRHAHIQNLK